MQQTPSEADNFIMSAVSRLPSSARANSPTGGPDGTENGAKPNAPQSSSTSATFAPKKADVSWDLGDEIQQNDDQPVFAPKRMKEGISNHGRIPGGLYKSPGEALQDTSAYRMLDAETRRVLLSLSDRTNYLGRGGRWFLYDYLTDNSFMDVRWTPPVRPFLGSAKLQIQLC